MTETNVDFRSLPGWDLSKIFSGKGDPNRIKTIATLRERAEEFRTNYHGRVGDLSAAELKSAFEQEGEIYELEARLGIHAFLSFAQNTQSETAQAMVSEMEELGTEVSSMLVFFDLELGTADADRWISSEELKEYHYQIHRAQKRAAHNLSEEMEAYGMEKNLAGRNALTNLFDEYFGQFQVKLEYNGKSLVLSEEEALASLHLPDRGYRTAVYRRFLESVGESRVVLSSIYNNILLDHRLDTERRKFPDLMAPRNMSNQVSGESVRSMLDVVENSYELARKYFRLKARVLGYSDFTNADIYAPLANTTETISYERAVEMVRDSYREFHPKLGDLVDAFFSEGRVDGALAEGKRSGAFCYGASPGLDAYIHLNYTGDIRSVQTLAHELGHGVHHQLSRGLNHTNFDTPLTTAETASVFGEILLNEKLMKESKDPATELSILASQMEGIIATVFRQTVLTRFEQRAHEKRREGRVSADAFCDLWWEENEKLYGDAVQMVDSYRWGWAYIPHFVHTPFYCYAYSFGQLLVLALYNEYMQKGDEFRENYIRLLSSGGSDRPDVLVKKTIGLDLADPSFWQSAMDLLSRNLLRIEELSKQVYS